MKLVSSFTWIQFEKFRGIDEEIFTVLNEAGEYIDGARKKAIVEVVLRRIQKLEEIAMSARSVVDDIEVDVKEDVARNYI